MVRKPWLVGMIRLLIVGILIGSLYGWARPRMYPLNTRFGFSYGVVHGAFMPFALPGLIMGHDVEIYATNNTGRTYKMGYIGGINLCGLIVFGAAFWRQGRKSRGAPEVGS